MDHKKIIDMSQKHLIPARIKTYAFHVFDTITKYGGVDRDHQLVMFLLRCAENKLENEPPASKCFEKSNADVNKRQGLVALLNRDKNWREKRSPGYGQEPETDRVCLLHDCPYSFFLTYAVDNKFSNDLLALKALCSDLPEVALLPNNYAFSLDSTCSIGVPEIASSDSQKSYWRKCSMGKCWEDSNAVDGNGRYLLFNNELLGDFNDQFELRPVFIAENFQAANVLEQEIKKNYIDYLLDEISTVTNSKPTPIVEQLKLSEWDAKLPLESSRLSAQTTYAPDDFLTLFRFTVQGAQRESRPCGDAIWVAPVGGYAMPWNTDWSPLANRDIFIFKFGEPDWHQTRQELLDISAAILNDIGKDFSRKLKFVLFPEKQSHDPSQNEILLLSLDEFFERYVVDQHVKIPEALLEIYENFLRRIRHKPRAHYIVEPFLRQKSWMLLTGEEGVGKTYFGMALGAAIATGGKLFWNWKVRNRGGKVLYIADDEMTDDLIAERRSVLKKIYPKLTNRFFVKTVHQLNLLNDADKNQVDRWLSEYALEGDESAVQVVFFDHLLKLTGAEGDQRENWVNIRAWIEELCARGVAVCLLHHEYGGKKMLGSRFIANDAPARIHLQTPSELYDNFDDGLNLEVSIQKNRGGRDQKQPKPLTLRLDNSPGWLDGEKVIKDTPSSAFEWRSLSKEERVKRITELRAVGCTNKNIAVQLGCSLGSIELCIRGLSADQKRPKGKSKN